MSPTAPTDARQSFVGELVATLRLAWPLIIAQLAHMALETTDVVMMGWLGPAELAAGTLAFSLLHPLMLGSFAIVSATAPLIAQARGARDSRSVRRSVRQGLWLCFAVAAIMTPVLYLGEAIFGFLHQPAETAALAQTYLNYAVWLLVPGMGLVVMRSFLAAHNMASVVLVVTIIGIFVNGALNYVLMFGIGGWPGMGLPGAGLSTALVSLAMFLMTFGFALTHRKLKRYALHVRFLKPDWPRFFELWRVGLPIGLSVIAEVGLFGAATILMGWLGPDELAAHAIALQCAALAFMVPLGLSQATTIRVGMGLGTLSRAAIRRAGWASVLLGLIFSATTSLILVLFRHDLVALFLNHADASTLAVIALAASYLGVAAIFQFVDGAQAVAMGALRGLSDTRAPMLVALFGYWVVGLGVAYVFAFPLGWRGVGVWFGLASGLAAVAIVLLTRFAMAERLNLVGDAR